MQNIRELSHDRVVLGAGTLYGAITTLLEKRWIEARPGEQDSRKKEYVITELGKQVCRDEITRLEELLSNGKQIVEGKRL